MDARIRELELAAATFDGELSVKVPSMWFLKGGLAGSEDRGNSGEACTCQMLDMMYKLRSLVKGLHRTVCGEETRVAGLTNAELVRSLSVITAALSGSESSVRMAICIVCHGFQFQAYSDARSPSAGGPSDQS